MGKRMFEQLQLAGTRVTLFEEASHLVESSASVPPRASGDWFKVLADALSFCSVYHVLNGCLNLGLVRMFDLTRSAIVGAREGKDLFVPLSRAG